MGWMMIRIEHNVETGEITEIELTQKEINELIEPETAEEMASRIEVQAKAAARASALAKLAALGLSPEEIAAL